MRHRVKSEKFSRNYGQRRALKKSLLRSLVVSERITTTHSRARELKRWADKLITWAKDDTLHHRRLSYRLLEDHLMVKRLFESIGPRFKDISGGYTRSMSVGFRKGDGAKLSIVELTKMEEKSKTKSKKKKIVENDKKSLDAKSADRKGLVSGVKKMFNKKEKGA
ncbi:MAG: 50S ribosomal protein L17 [Candidatus Omnitrophica bacterium]|nr:50S ribosomal protein L17 [Candidatus Omnitrophota bacterium]